MPDLHLTLLEGAGDVIVATGYQGGRRSPPVAIRREELATLLYGVEVLSGRLPLNPTPHLTIVKGGDDA